MAWQDEMITEVLSENANFNTVFSKAENKETLKKIILELFPELQLANKKYLSHADIKELHGVGDTKATKMIKEIQAEQLRIDSKIPSDSVIHLNSRQRKVRRDVLEWYSENRFKLEDKNARKRLDKFS